MHLTIITVCRDMADYLAITLPKNRKHADAYMVVSADDDHETWRVCESQALDILTRKTPHLRDRGRFPKGMAINEALQPLRAFAMANDGKEAGERLDWIQILDADMILPDDFRERLEAIPKDSNTIYGTMRYDWPADQYLAFQNRDVGGFDMSDCKMVENRKDIGVGAFQLFHASAKCLRGKDKWYPEKSDDATLDDRRFVQQWPEGKRDTETHGTWTTVIAKELEGIHPIHIGILGVNHKGRVSPQIGTKDPMEEIRVTPEEMDASEAHGVNYKRDIPECPACETSNNIEAFKPESPGRSLLGYTHYCCPCIKGRGGSNYLPFRVTSEGESVLHNPKCIRCGCDCTDPPGWIVATDASDGPWCPDCNAKRNTFIAGGVQDIPDLPPVAITQARSEGKTETTLIPVSQIHNPYSRGVIYLINESNGFNMRLAISIWSLRKHWEGWITILVNEGGSVSMDDMNAIADHFDCDVQEFPHVGKGRKISLPIKTRLHEFTPYDCTVFIDADTFVQGSIDELFEMAEDHKTGMVFTDWGWVCGGRKMQKRLRPWIEAGYFDQPPEAFPAVNTGVFAFRKDTKVMPEWARICHEGMPVIKDFYADESCGGLLAWKMGTCIAPPKFNRSILEPDLKEANDAVIVHGHGKKHIRQAWLEPEDIRPPGSVAWCKAFEECVADHPWVLDLHHDKHTKFYLKWRAGGVLCQAEDPVTAPSAPPFPKSRVAPTDGELEYLARLVKEHNPRHVLELGAGITTYIIGRNRDPGPYTIVEGVPATDQTGFQANVDSVKEHVPEAEWLTEWEYGDREFDFLFLDSSAGNPHNRATGLFRLDALKAAEPNLAPGAVVCVHDWHGRSGKAVVAYIEASDAYRVLSHQKGKTGIGAAIYEPMGRAVDSGDLGAPITDFSDITLTMVANSQQHADRAKATMDSFRKMKGFNGPTILFLTSLIDPIPDWADRVVVLDNNGKDAREEALAAFVFGSEWVNTRWCLKLDAAMYCVGREPFLFEKMLDYSLVAMPWGYTKGAQMIRMMDHWLDGHVKSKRMNPFDACKFQGVEDTYPMHGDGDKPWKTKHKARRIISRVRLATTQMLRYLSELCDHDKSEPGLRRLPIPSEDTTLWRYCERLRIPWMTFKFGNCGIAHSKKILKVRDEHPEYF